MQESIVFCSACIMSSLRKFTFAISSPDEFLVGNGHKNRQERNYLTLSFASLLEFSTPHERQACIFVQRDAMWFTG